MSKHELIANPENELIAEVRKHIAGWDDQLKHLLPSAPDSLEVRVSQSPVAEHGYSAYKEAGWDYGVGGSTINPHLIDINIDTESGLMPEDLNRFARSTYFHERYHLARNYSFETSSDLGLLDISIEEGLATKFEMIEAGSKPWHGHYSDRETMLATLEEVKNSETQPIDWNKWKFYDPKTNRHWILYRLGAFIVDEALTNNPALKIQDLLSFSREEILKLAKI